MNLGYKFIRSHSKIYIFNLLLFLFIAVFAGGLLTGCTNDLALITFNPNGINDANVNEPAGETSNFNLDSINIWYQNSHSMMGFIGYYYDEEKNNVFPVDSMKKDIDMLSVMDAVVNSANYIKSNIDLTTRGKSAINYYWLDGKEENDNGIINWKNVQQDNKDFYKQADKYTASLLRGNYSNNTGPMRLFFQSEYFKGDQLNIIITNLIEHNMAQSDIGKQFFDEIINKYDNMSCTIFAVNANFAGDFNVVSPTEIEIKGNDYTSVFVEDAHTLFYIIITGPDDYVRQYTNKLREDIKKVKRESELNISDEIFKNQETLSAALNNFCFWVENISIGGGISYTKIDYTLETIPNNAKNDTNDYYAPNVVPSFYTNSQDFASDYLNEKNVMATLNAILENTASYFTPDQDLYLFRYEDYINKHLGVILNFYIPLDFNQMTDITQLINSVNNGRRKFYVDLDNTEIYVYLQKKIYTDTDTDNPETSEGWYSLKKLLKESDIETSVFHDLKITAEVFVHADEKYENIKVPEMDDLTDTFKSSSKKEKYSNLINKENNWNALTAKLKRDNDDKTEQIIIQLRVKMIETVELIKKINRYIDEINQKLGNKENNETYIYQDYPPVFTMPVNITNSTGDNSGFDPTPNWVQAISCSDVNEDIEARLKHTIKLDDFYINLSAHSYGVNITGNGEDSVYFTVTDMNFAIYN